jgi:DNA anti-recombination protein RmuC
LRVEQITGEHLDAFARQLRQAVDVRALEHFHRLARLRQRFGEMGADESGAPQDQTRCHGGENTVSR